METTLKESFRILLIRQEDIKWACLGGFLTETKI
jgi:hypothetical protein